MLVISLVLISIAVASKSPRIIAGEQAPMNGEYPDIQWQVALSLGGGLCGGSIVSPTHVVTAAHCVKNLFPTQYLDPTRITVVPGFDRTATSSSNARQVLQYWVAPQYSEGAPQEQWIDIAVLEVTEPFNFVSSSSAPITMCEDATTCHSSPEPLIVSGYGQTVSEDSSSIPNLLRYATLTSVSQAACESKFEDNFGCTSCLPVADVCAESDPPSANPGKDSCFGDSGGPLVRNFGTQAEPQFQLVGVVSSGTVPVGSSLAACGQPGEYGLYVSVPRTLPWIRSVMSGAENSSAITSDCIVAGTCPDSSGGGVIPPDDEVFLPFSYYYIASAVVAGIIILLLLVTCALRQCNRHRNRSRMAASAAASHRDSSVHVIPAPAPQAQAAAVAPPPVYPASSAPAYQEPAYQDPDIDPGLLPGQQYVAEPQNYGAASPAASAPPQDSPPPFNPYANNNSDFV